MILLISLFLNIIQKRAKKNKTKKKQQYILFIYLDGDYDINHTKFIILNIILVPIAIQYDLIMKLNNCKTMTYKIYYHYFGKCKIIILKYKILLSDTDKCLPIIKEN